MDRRVTSPGVGIVICVYSWVWEARWQLLPHSQWIRGKAICLEGERRKIKLEAWIKDKAWSHTNGGVEEEGIWLGNQWADFLETAMNGMDQVCMDHLLAGVYSNPTWPSPPILFLAGTEVPGHGSDSGPVVGMSHRQWVAVLTMQRGWYRWWFGLKS